MSDEIQALRVYADRPEDIIFQNRTLQPTLQNLQQQVTSLARVAFDDRLAIADLPDIRTKIAILDVPRQGDKVIRPLNTDFTISATRDALVFYTLELTTALLLAGTDEVTVDLVVGGQVISTVKSRITMTLILGVTRTDVQQKVLSGMIPRSAVANLTVTSNNGTAILISSYEVLI